MTDLPHFRAPFHFTNGVVDVVEQDTPDEIAACLFNIAVCPVGARDDQPDFGIPDPTFATAPLDTTPLADALARWEPRADLALIERAAADVSQRVITVNAYTDTPAA